MTTKPRASKSSSPSQSQLGVQRIRVNAEGYDRGGSYWGAGPDVYIVTTADGAVEITVRARNFADARQKAAVELDDTPRASASPVRKPIGGHPSRKSRFEIDWRSAITGETVRLRITHARNYLSQGSDHIEIESIAPKRAPLPITETGYRSHFMKAEDLAALGGARRFVESWLATTAKSKEWQRSQQAAAQGDLFQWAAATTEVVAKHGKARRPKAAASRRRRARDASPE